MRRPNDLPWADQPAFYEKTKWPSRRRPNCLLWKDQLAFYGSNTYWSSIGRQNSIPGENQKVFYENTKWTITRRPNYFLREDPIAFYLKTICPATKPGIKFLQEVHVTMTTTNYKWLIVENSTLVEISFRIFLLVPGYWLLQVFFK